jgi:YVTN family beta-propeller protein
MGVVVFIADVTESDALENLIVEVGAKRGPGRRLRPARTVASIAVVAGLFAALVVGVSLRHPVPHAELPAAFPSSTNLLGYWSADGQTLTATAGADLAGTPSYADGPSGKAFSLTAGTLPSTGLAPVSDAVSVMMWVRPSNVGSVMSLASRSTGPGMTSSLDDRHSFDLWLDPIGALVWQTDDVGARVPEDLRASVPTIFDGQYHLVAATWDATAINVYLDGSLVTTKKSQGGTLNAAINTPFSLGRPFAYTGAIDEPSVWARVLTANEIASYYNATPHVTATVPVANPVSMAFDGTSIWAVNYRVGTVSKINPTTNTVTATVTVGRFPHGVAFDGTSIWVTNNGSGTVSKINPTTNTVTATVTVGVGPYGVMSDGTSIWVTDSALGTVSKIDPITNTVTATVTVGASPAGLAFDGTSIWVTNYGSGTVSKIDPTTNTVTATVTVSAIVSDNGYPWGVAFDGTSIWVATNASDRVSKIDPATNTVTAIVTVGTNPYRVAFDGTSIWVTNYGSGTVSKINPATNTVTATVTVGTNPYGVAFDGTNIWVANLWATNPNLGSLSKISI